MRLVKLMDRSESLRNSLESTQRTHHRDGVVDYLWGSIRSAHFHGGEFPLGEFSPIRLMDPLMGFESTNQQNLQLFIYPLIREVIVRWIYDQLAGTDIDGEDG